MTYTMQLLQPGNLDVTSAGGKGANLSALITAGFPVPPGFVLTTDAYDAFVRENSLRQQIIDVVSKGAMDSPRAGEAASGAIKMLFLNAEIPEAVKVDLFAECDRLTKEAQVAVAVRSSAPFEDSPQGSFAGQHETFLGVVGEEALQKAVKECWASLWTARALAYRERMGIDHEAAAMAVVVQMMAPADVSGILFTVNPTTGSREELVVNASFGLGEAIVSGQVTPDTYVLNRENMTVNETTSGAKEVMIVSAAEGGTTTQSVSETQRIESVLSQGLLGELAALGVRVEEHFGVPQDIEWSLADGRFWLLQARPITNLPPTPLQDVRWEPLRPGSVWMRRQVVEHMPEPLSPLFDELYLQEGLDQSMQSFADSMSEMSGLKIDIWDIIQPPFATTVNGYAYSLANFEMNRRLIPLVLRIYVVVLPKIIRHLYPRWRDKSLPAYRATIQYWKGIDLAKAADDDLLRGIRELAYEDAVYWFAAAVPLGLARITDSVLDAFLRNVVTRGDGENGPHPTSGAYLWGFPSKAMEAQIQLEGIATKIRDTDTLHEDVANTPASRLLQMLAGHPDGQSVLQDLQHYLDAYGHQVYNLDFAVPTLADDPLPVLLSLITAVEHPERDARVRQAQLAQEREAHTARTERSLNLIQRPIFHSLLRWAQRYAPIREEALFYVGAAWPALRRFALELGERLTAAGSLDAPDDVFFLRSDELTSASVARANGLGRPELAKLARERRALREARKRLDPPVVVPLDGRMKFGPIDMAMFEPKPRTARTGPTLEGYAVSPGQISAPASVIRSPEEFDKMAPDTILVCTTTTPAWTPLFAQAKGLVTDIGGALAHGSIVAREYGIPAVMGTGVATQRIENGQLLRVDGDAGIVTLLDETDSGAIGELNVEETGSPAKNFALAAAVVVLVIGLLVWWKKRSS